MDSKTFISPDGRFSLELPINWQEYDDGDENTYAFFNADSWTGNFRITPFYLTKPDNASQNKATEFVRDELVKNEGAVQLKLGAFDCAHYKKDIEQDGDNLVVYYWSIGSKNNLFICSLTIGKEQEGQTQNKLVLETVQNIIISIKTI